MPMNNFPKIFSYKLSRDFGFAPNPFHGICTLATCKPQIRRSAQVGDIVIGCGSQELKMQGRIIFAMKVSEKISFDEYWNDPRFEMKKPSFKSSRSMGYGDNIYHHEGDQWRQEDSHHSFANGVTNFDNQNRDTGADHVLISNDFIYWGANAPKMDLSLRDLDGDDLLPKGRNYRTNFSDNFRIEVSNWFSGLPKGCVGRPTCW